MLFVRASAMSAAQNHHLEVCSSQTARTGMSSKKRMDVLVIGSSRSGTIIPYGGAECNRRQKICAQANACAHVFRGRSCRLSLNYLRGFLMFACKTVSLQGSLTSEKFLIICQTLDLLPIQRYKKAHYCSRLPKYLSCQLLILNLTTAKLI